jgi:hypothetical protein
VLLCCGYVVLPLNNLTAALPHGKTAGPLEGGNNFSILEWKSFRKKEKITSLSYGIFEILRLKK